MPKLLPKADPKFAAILAREEHRQQDKLSLIPSENFFSPAVRAAVGSVFAHKYAEGNIGHRYYEGNQYIDELESLAIARAKKLFRLPAGWDVNVQALSGSNANLAVYVALLQPGDTIMGLYLPDGGHLSHGWSYEPTSVPRAGKTPGVKGSQTPGVTSLVYLGGSRKVNLTSQLFKTVQYKTSPKNQRVDYRALEQTAKKFRPQLIISGGTAYPRLLDHKKMKRIAKAAGALYLADIAHEAGLVAARVIPSPVGSADIVTMTTHKTLRSGRGAIILAHRDIIAKVNRALLPGLQGGPHYHNIAGMCVGLGEALTPAFRRYSRQVVKNAQALATALTKQRFTLVTGGADKHLLLINLTDEPLLGKKFARALDYAGLVANFNTMPQETRSPADPSALRLGTPWVTTRGLGKHEMKQIAVWLRQVMTTAAPWATQDFTTFNTTAAASPALRKIAREVKALCRRFPLQF